MSVVDAGFACMSPQVLLLPLEQLPHTCTNTQSMLVLTVGELGGALCAGGGGSGACAACLCSSNDAPPAGWWVAAAWWFGVRQLLLPVQVDIFFLQQLDVYIPECTEMNHSCFAHVRVAPSNTTCAQRTWCGEGLQEDLLGLPVVYRSASRIFARVSPSLCVCFSVRVCSGRACGCRGQWLCSACFPGGALAQLAGASCAQQRRQHYY